MIKNFRVLKSLFLVQDAAGLGQVLNVQIDNSGAVVPGHLEAQVGGYTTTVQLPEIARGLNAYPITIPEVEGPTPAHFVLHVGEEQHEAQITLDRVRRWKIYLIPFSHHDLGYTDQPQVCIEQHKEYFRRIVDYCRQTDDFPQEARFRWTCDTTWAVKYFLEEADEETRAEFMDWVRAGRIEITALYAAFNSALLTHEELVRSIYYAFRLARRYGFGVTSGMTTDIPGNPWGLVPVLAKSGVRYLSTAVNQNWAQDGVPRAKVPRVSRPFYWVGPDGSRLLVWNSDPEHIYSEGRQLGFTESERAVYANLPPYLRVLEEGGYPFDALHLRTTCKTSDNAPPCVYLSEIVRAWNARWAYPRLIVATNSQFFRYMEETFGDQFPEYSGDWTDWWIDGPGSSAYETGINREMHEVLASAEKLAAIGALVRGDGDYPAAQIEQAYDNLMLYDEHTWGMWNNVTDPYLPSTREHWLFKAEFGKQAARLSRGLLQSGLSRLGGLVQTGDAPTLVVFNALSWPRSATARVRLEGDVAARASKGLRIVASDGREVPYQVVESHLPGGSVTLDVWAEDIPAFGYRTYRLLEGPPGLERAPSTRISEHAIENRFFRVTLDPATGAISSIFDQELGVELVDQASCYRLNQFVYDSGEPPIFGRFSPQGAEIMAGPCGPLASSLVALTRCGMGKHVRLSEPHWGRGRLAETVVPWIRQEVILYEDVKRIDLVNRLYKEETLEKEGVYYAFPFAVQGSDFRLEIAGAVVRPGIDQLPDSCHDWHSVGYWLDVSGPRYGVTWASREVPVVSIGDINTGKWQTTLPLKDGTFFAYAMNNYWTTNFKESQGGDFCFRFSLVSHGQGWGHPEAARFGWGVCTDLAATVLPPGQAGVLDDAAFSLCQVDAPNVMAFTLKQAEDGDGFIIRLMELSGVHTPVRLTFPTQVHVHEAHRADIVERNLERLRVTGREVAVDVPAYGIETVRVRMAWA
jgi:hypothetical protein